MNERIKQIRNSLGMTQQEFADRLKINRSNIANYEKGLRTPVDAVISLICKEFSISESWLRTGEGDMYIALDRDDEITLLVSRAIEGGTDFQKALIKMLCSCTEKELEVLERKFREIAEGLDK